MRVDAHQHFWKFDPARDQWISDDMKILRRNFMPDDLAPLLDQNLIGGCVAVQADQSEDETHFLLDLAGRFDFIKGVVGWVDLCAENIEERLEYFSSFGKLKGFRHLIQEEPDSDFMLRPDFCNGVSRLRKYGFTYDVLIQQTQLPPVQKFIGRFPDQPFVIDHLAKPLIRSGDIKEWTKEIKKLAAFSNVYCKLSGMVTEGDLANWKLSDFRPYIDTVVDSFGIDRVMFGSDWPVCLLGASYQQCCLILEENTLDLNPGEKDKLWGQTASTFYGLRESSI